MNGELFNNIIEQVLNPLWISDEKGIIIRMNQALKDLLKITDDEIVGKYNVLDDRQVREQGFAPLVKSVFEEGKTVNFMIDYDTAKEGQVKLGQTTHKILDLVISPIKNREGKVVNAICQHKDITEQEKAKAELRESEQRYRILFETTGTATVIIEEDMTVSLANSEIENFSGYSQKEFTGKSWIDFIVEDDLARLREYHNLRMTNPEAAPKQYECRLKDKWGNIKNVLVTINIIPGTKSSIASVLDITEHKRAEEELRKSLTAIQQEKDKLLALLNNMTDEVWYIDSGGDITLLNAVAAEDFKLPKDGKPLALKKLAAQTEVLNTDGKPRPLKESPALRTLKGEIIRGLEEIIRIPLTGELRYRQVSSSPIINADNQIIGAVSVVRDITEYKKAEMALLAEKDKARKYWNLAGTMLLAIDANGKISDVNRKGCEILEYDEKDIIGKDWADNFIPESMRENVKTIFKEIINGTMQTLEHVEGFTIISKSGREKLISWHNSVIRDETGKIIGTLSSGEDITERKKAEEALRQSEEKYRTIMKLALDGFTIDDFKGKLLEVNDSYCKMMGYTREELLEMYIPDVEAIEKPKETEQHIKKIKEQGYDRFETRHKRKDGRIIDLDVSINYIDIEGGQLFVSVRDITERKQMEKTLRESEELFRHAFENANTGMCLVDLDGNITKVNGMMSKIFGYSQEELERMTVNDIAHPEDVETSPRFIKQTLSGKVDSGVFEKRYIHKQGHIVYGLVSSSLVRDSSGNPLYFISQLQDVTERKKAEDRIAHLATFPEVNPMPVLEFDMDGKVTYMNPSANKDFPDLLSQGKQHPFMADWDIVVEAIKNEKSHLYRRDIAIGDSWFEQTLTYLLQNQRIRVYCRNITRRKQAEEALYSSMLRYRTVADNTYDFELWLNPEGQYIYASPSCQRIFGATPEEFMHDPGLVRRMVHPDDLINFDRHMAEEAKKTQGEIEFRILRPDGTQRWIAHVCQPVFDRSGQYLGVRGSNRDITGHKRAEETLRESEDKLRSVVENSSDQIFMLDKDCKFLLINKTVADIFRKSPQQVIGRSIFEIFPEETADRFSKNIKNVFDTGKSLNIEEKMFAGGLEFYNNTSLNPVRNDKGNVIAVTGIVRDITERKRMEDERQKIDKLESVGILAGGIAHDFNNLLTGIIGNISLAKRYAGTKGKASEMLEEAEKATFRARDLTQQLLTFSRGGAPVKKLVSISELIKESATFALRGSKVKSEFSIPEDLWAVEADEGQISQVIHNLVKNADEAMPEGGIINISAKNITVQDQSTLPLSKGRYIEVVIKDSGIGIRKEHLARMFEPYFTTKHKGSGLGLATAYSIIKKHNGYIAIDSELGFGTTFYVYLPASRKQLPKREEEVVVRPARVGQGKILVMDDEEMIREMLNRMLVLAGYKVELTSNGADAIKRYKEAKESDEPIDAVIMDLTIPGGMGGKEAIKKLLEIDPDAKVIVSSGYETDPIMAEYKKYGFSAVIKKPFSVRQLENELHKLLGKK